MFGLLIYKCHICSRMVSLSTQAFNLCHFDSTMAAPPMGASMIVVHEPYTSLILSGAKTHELRAKRVLGTKYLACSTTHEVKAIVHFGESRLLSDDEYAASFHEHRCRAPVKRYKTTWSTKIRRVILLKTPVPYKPKAGAIGYARYYGA